MSYSVVLPKLLKNACNLVLTLVSVAAVSLAASLVALTPNAAVAAENNKAPLVLTDQGSFYTGGRIVTSEAISGSGVAPVPGDISVDHIYVQYQVPQNGKYRYPIIMVHGGGHTGKTYETTPDGREGWYTSFTRRGFAPYVVDDPNRGRACCEPTRIHLVRLGLQPHTTLPATDIYSKQRAWTTFRFGPGYPVIYDNSRFPFDAIDQYAAQWVLTYRDAAELNKIADGITAVIDRVCPCILMTHSQSGPQGLRAALRRPNLVKAYISVEPAGFAIPAGESAATLANVPILTVFGDYVGQNPGDPAVGWLNGAQNTATLVNAAGGNASVLVLPDQGIIGNTHMMMMDNNNEQIADLIETWIQNNVPGVKGKYKP